MNTKTIFFDMDGTIADLYGVENWLDMLINEDPTPYAVATPLLRLCTFARMVNRLQSVGYRIAVNSWLSMNGSAEYNEAVTMAKLEWLSNHLPSVEWDEIQIHAYGMPKYTYANKGDILFDDEENNRNAWVENLGGNAYDEKNLIENLKNLLTNGL